ncbi:hypothetical protein X961_4871 [Burkholderia pseudomallei MSHR5613]|nr:hypothetical protein X961_4871 [Burkholderia pseudomallei MSHR5613]
MLRVSDFVLCHQPGTNRPECVETLSLVPLGTVFELPFALRHIVDHAIACDVAERISLANVFGLLSDHHSKLDLPIRLGRPTRDFNIVVWTANRTCPFSKYSRLCGDRQIRFCCVIGIVQPNADELAYSTDTRADPWITVDHRERSWIERAQPFETVVG